MWIFLLWELWRLRQRHACEAKAHALMSAAELALARGDIAEAKRLTAQARAELARCQSPQVQGGNGLQFLSMLRPAPKVQGAFWESKQWHAVYNGRGWLGPLKMTASEASDWHIAQLDAMSHHQPFSNIQLHRWNGSKWQRVA